MKKGIAGVFAVSITAGTLCLAYSMSKDFFIAKLFMTWTLEAQKKDKSFSIQQLDYLKQELGKLYPWQIRLLHQYFQKVFNKAPEAEVKAALTKVNKQELLKKADLRNVERVLGSS